MGWYGVGVAVDDAEKRVAMEANNKTFVSCLYCGLCCGANGISATNIYLSLAKLEL